MVICSRKYSFVFARETFDFRLFLTTRRLCQEVQKRTIHTCSLSHLCILSHSTACKFKNYSQTYANHDVSKVVTLPPYLLIPCAPLWSNEGICSSHPLVLILGFEFHGPVSCHCDPVCHTSCLADLHCTSLGLRRRPGWLHYHAVLLDLHFFLCILSSCGFL